MGRLGVRLTDLILRELNKGPIQVHSLMRRVGYSPGIPGHLGAFTKTLGKLRSSGTIILEGGMKLGTTVYLSEQQQ